MKKVYYDEENLTITMLDFLTRYFCGSRGGSRGTVLVLPSAKQKKKQEKNEIAKAMAQKHFQPCNELYWIIEASAIEK